MTETTVPPTVSDPEETEARLASLRSLIGNTPLLDIRCRFRGTEHHVYAKHEAYNLTASIKDRMAYHIMRAAYADGTIKPGDTIAEATSGNTGISFSAIGRALGHPVRIYMPDWMSRERVLVIQSLGAAVIPVSAEEGGFQGSIDKVREFAAKNGNVFQPCQFDAPANVTAHEMTTGPEILGQLRTRDLTPTAFVAGVGTGGTVMGVGRCFRRMLDNVTIHPLEPANSPTLRTGHKVGKHRIQGISDEFIPSILDLDALDDIVDTWDGDAILMAQKLAGSLGLALGISSGANFLGALQIADRQGPGSVVTTVFADCSKKYLSTDLCTDEEMKEHYLTHEVELLGFRVIPSLCEEEAPD